MHHASRPAALVAGNRHKNREDFAVKKCFVAIGALVALAVPSAAMAADSHDGINDGVITNKQIWHAGPLDPIASEIAGFPLQVMTSDNVTEWNAIVGNQGPYSVLGFTAPDALPSSWIYNPHDGRGYYVYRTVWLNPEIDATFRSILTSGINESSNAYSVAKALMTLDHEAQHQRLHSGDEGRVNACALADLPRLLNTRFNVPSTTTVTVPSDVPYQEKVKVKYRVKVKKRWVYRYRYKYVDRIRTEYVQQTVANPTFTRVMDAAMWFRANQPAPYSTGTCY
jgi:hypothetical protein